MPSVGSFVCNPRRCLVNVYWTKPCMKPASTANSLIIHLIIVWKQPLLNACLADPKSPYLSWENIAFSRFTNKLKVWEVDIFCLSVCCTNDLSIWFLPSVLMSRHVFLWLNVMTQGQNTCCQVFNLSHVPGPQWKKKAHHGKLSSDLQMHTTTHSCAHTNAHTHSN